MSSNALAIILIHHQMREHLRGCLRSIDRYAANTKTVVAHLPTDQDDGHWIRDEFPWVDVVFADRFGIASMRNVAMKAVGPDHSMLIFDADARLHEGAIETLQKFMDENPTAGAAGPQTRRADGGLEPNAKRFYTWMTVFVRRTPLNNWWPDNPWTRRHLMADKDWSRPFQCDWIAGAAMFLRAEALAQIGDFDERYTFGFEDVDWCFRAKQADWEIWYCPAATIEHHVQRKSAHGINRLTIEHLKSLWRFYRKHGRLK